MQYDVVRDRIEKEKKVFLKRLLFVTIMLGLLIPSGEVCAQTGALNKDPSTLLKKYLTLDIRGARLSAISWDAQEPYIDWHEEPVWGHIVVVTGYEVLEDVQDWKVNNNVDVVIPVDFKVLGSVYLDRATFLPEPQTERISFHVKAVRGYWRIVDPIVPPHVGYKRVLNFVQQALVEEGEPSKRETLAALRDELKKTQ